MTALLIDGRLVAGGSGTFDSINPATEEPIGPAADGDAADMDRAIGAARSAFDDSDWSRDVALRVHCLRQLRSALNAEIEALRAITVAEVGAPVTGTRMRRTCRARVRQLLSFTGRPHRHAVAVQRARVCPAHLPRAAPRLDPPDEWS